MEGRKKQAQEKRLRDDRGLDRQEDDGEDRPRRWRRPSRTQAFWLFFVLVMIFTAKFFGSKPSDPQLVSYKEYRQYLEEGRIAEAVIVGERDFEGVLHDGTRFVVNLGPIDAETKREWGEQEVNFRFEEEPFRWYNFLFSFLPWLLFIAFWIFMLRQMQGGARGLFSFGKSRAKLLMEDKHKTTFADVAGGRRGQERVGGDH